MPSPHPYRITVAALYHFAPVKHVEECCLAIDDMCKAAAIKGTILIAPEGINGTIASDAANIETVICYIRAIEGFGDLDVKYSYAAEMPFYRMKVRVKREIVTMGVDGVDPTCTVGQYVAAKDWNALISDPDTLVIDTRNDYEARIGSFAGAIDPQTESFRDFPAWFRDNRDALLQGKKRVAMFCTGGIRCEKSTSFLKNEGIEDVYHLQGGILRYLEDVPETESLWRGDCFVFDQRVAVTHGLAQGSHGRCHACRDPLSPEDMASCDYVEGISCPHCIDRFDAADRKRFAERQRQVALAEKRGIDHIGAKRGDG